MVFLSLETVVRVGTKLVAVRISYVQPAGISFADPLDDHPYLLVPSVNRSIFKFGVIVKSLEDLKNTVFISVFELHVLF